jgi:ferrous iron transport protein B
LNGRAVIPLILGLGCTTMGTITTRILPTDKERMITIALLGIAIPCAAQQGIIVVLLASIGGLKVWLLYLLMLFLTMAAVGTLLSKFAKGKTSDLFISLPPLRVPNFLNITKKTVSRMVSFLKEATGFFVLSSIIISTMNYFGWLKAIEKALEPIVVNILHLPSEFSNVFIMGLIRRDLAASGLFEMASVSNMTPLQIFVSAVVITLFVPCIAMLIMVFKERGIKEGVILWISAFCIAIGAGAVLTRVCGILF